MLIDRVACRCAQVQTYIEFPERPYNNGEVVIIIPISAINIMLLLFCCIHNVILYYYFTCTHSLTNSILGRSCM
jgi:hypothetical protein